MKNTRLNNKKPCKIKACKDRLSWPCGTVGTLIISWGDPPPWAARWKRVKLATYVGSKTNMLLAALTKLNPDEVVALELPLWMAIDRVQCGNSDEWSIGAITRHAVMLQIIGADRQHRELYDYTTQAITKWLAALETAAIKKQRVNLSTQTQKIVYGIAKRWGIVLNQIDLGLLNGAALRWNGLAKQFGVPA